MCDKPMVIKQSHYKDVKTHCLAGPSCVQMAWGCYKNTQTSVHNRQVLTFLNSNSLSVFPPHCRYVIPSFPTFLSEVEYQFNFLKCILIVMWWYGRIMTVLVVCVSSRLDVHLGYLPSDEVAKSVE